MYVFEETRQLIELQKRLFNTEPTAGLVPFSDMKPLTSKYVCEFWQREWDEAGLSSNKF